MESKYDYVVFDIETTGLHPESDQICEIAAIGVKDGLPHGLFSTLVAIEGSMPEAAGRVNGITDDMLKGAPAIRGARGAQHPLLRHPVRGDRSRRGRKDVHIARWVGDFDDAFIQNLDGHLYAVHFLTSTTS